MRAIARMDSPLVAALLEWRKAERIATTYGYSWLDEHLGADGRLRGAWTGSDGAAGRMTASSGLHNMPAELRPAVRADAGWRLVRADLGVPAATRIAACFGNMFARARIRQNASRHTCSSVQPCVIPNTAPETAPSAPHATCA